jgi:hypothetical protein
MVYLCWLKFGVAIFGNYLNEITDMFGEGDYRRNTLGSFRGCTVGWPGVTFRITNWLGDLHTA